MNQDLVLWYLKDMNMHDDIFEQFSTWIVKNSQNFRGKIKS